MQTEGGHVATNDLHNSACRDCDDLDVYARISHTSHSMHKSRILNGLTGSLKFG